MSSGLRTLGLLAALVAVGAAAWVLLSRPDSRARSRAGDRDPVAKAKPDGAGPAGVDAREVTIAGDGVVSGHVVDEDGGAVVEGQLVLWCHTPDGRIARIRDGVLSLDDEGHFEGPACRGEVCPELRHPARVPAEPWSLRPGADAELRTRVLARLVGRVLDPDGAPVPAAQIVVTPPRDEDPSAVLPVMSPTTSTDDDGEFSLARIERPPCDPCQAARGACSEDPLPVLERVLVNARAVGWAPGSVEVDLLELEGSDATVEVVLGPVAAAITGALVDARGSPLPRAVVLARSEQREQEQHRSEAAQGVFAFEALGEGTYTVRAIQDGRELARREGVAPGDTVELRLEHALRDVELTLLDEQGRPWPSVEVQGGPFPRHSSDASGRVQARGVLPGTYIVRVRPPGQKARAREVEIPSEAAQDPAEPISLTLRQ